MNLQKDYNLYSAFIKVCEVKSYSKAAELLNYSSHQSISEKMSALAKQIGVKTLFNKHSKGVQPTSEALELYKRIKPLFAQVDSAEKNIKDFDENSHAVIKMIIPATNVAAVWGDFFKQFQKKYHNVQFEFFNRADVQNYDLFLLGKVDLVIDLKHICKNHWMKAIDLLTIDYVFIATREFLTENNLNKKINKDELSKYRLIAHRELIKAISNEIGWTPATFIKTATLEPICPLVEIGAGIGLYPKKFLSKNNKFVELDSDIKVPSMTMSLGYNEETASKAVKTFVNDIIKFCSS